MDLANLTPRLLADYSKAMMIDVVVAFVDRVFRLTGLNSELTAKNFDLTEQLSIVAEQSTRF